MVDVKQIMQSKIPQATSSMTPTRTTKTAYQEYFSEPVAQEWKLGDKPTNYGQALATINNMAKTDQASALEKLNLLNQYRTQPGNIWYDPFASATNRDVDTLKSYGIDPTTLTDEWFNTNKEWQAYLRYNGTTNTPSKPTKKSSEQEKLSYALYQFQKSMGDTTSAKNEWSAAQDEINYWVNRKDLNLSDDDIISRVFGSNKYKTLGKMDSTRSTASPLELNEAIDYNPDSVRGVIWAARNGGGTGNIRQDIANYYSRTGNMWRENTSISAKLNKKDQSTYSPHEVGMTGDDMDKAGAYFNVSSFAPGSIEELRSKVDWNDATSVKMFQNVVDAENTTLKAEEELANFNKVFENRMKRPFASQEEADAWIEDTLNSGAYNTLLKMDDGILKGDPINLTRAVPYRKQMYQKAAADAIANPKKTGDDVLNSYGVDVSDATKSTTKVENENIASSVDAMERFLTQNEKDYLNSVPGIEYVSLAATIGDVKGNIGANAGIQYGKVNGDYTNTVLSSIPIVTEYEKYKAVAERLNNQIIEFEQAHKGDMLSAAEIEPEANVKLSDGTMAHLVYDPVIKMYTLDSLSADSETARAEAQQIIDKGNQRLRERSEQIDMYGEASPELREQLDQIAKDKEQLNTIYEWLGTHAEEYNAANRAVRESKMKRDAIGEIAANAMGAEYDPTVADSIIDFAGSFYQYDIPVADGKTLIDEISGVSNEDVRDYIAENDAAIKDLQFVLSALGDNAPQEIVQKMNGAIAYAEQQNRIYNDYLITNDPNYDALVAQGKKDFEDVYNGYVTKGTSKNWFFMFSPEEQDIYYAIAERDGIEAADQYYADMRDELKQKRERDIQETTERIAKSGWLGRITSEIGSILTAPINTLGGVVYAAGVAMGWDESEMRAAKQSTHISQSMHSANINELKNIYGEDTALGQFLTGAYEILYNRGISWVNALTLGKLMPQIGLEGKVADVLNDVLSATPIALSAASDALESAIDRGANPAQQALIFASTLIAESWTEGIEFGHIEKAGKQLLTKEGFLKFLKDYPATALSEIIGETLNDKIELRAGNEWAKMIENPNYQSEHDANVERYMAEDDTLTREQAEAKVYQDEIAGVLHTAIISAFSPSADILIMAGNTVKKFGEYAAEAKAYNEGATGKHAKKKSIRDIRLEHEAADAKAAEDAAKAKEMKTRAEANEQQTAETAQPAAEPEQFPVNGPDESRARSYAKAKDEYNSNIILLEEVTDANATTQAAAIASAINTGDTNMAQAAAAKLNLGMVQAMFVAGRQANVNMQTLALGIQLAALGNGECANIMANGVANGMSATQMANQLAAAVSADMQNPAVAQSVTSGIHDARVNEEFKRLMAGLESTATNAPTNAEGAMERLSAGKAVKAIKAIKDARKETKTAEDNYNRAQNELKAAQNGVSEAAAAIAADPINDGNQMTAALSKMTSAAAVAEEYKQALEKARQKQESVESENLKLAEETTASLRQQAENTVREQETAEAQAKAEAEAQAQAEAQAAAIASAEKQQEDNMTRVDADAFIEQTNPNATEEQKEHIREIFQRVKDEMGKTADAHLARKQFEQRFAKRFGLTVKHVDSVDENGKKFTLFNARINPKTGELLINKNATQDDMFYAVLIHEITHLAEQNKDAYAELADSILQMQYGEGVTYQGILDTMGKGDNTSRLAQDILGKKGLYDKQLGQSHTNEEMLQEIIADGVGEIISKDQAALESLVAEKPGLARRILDGILNFLKGVAGIKSPAITQAQQVADMLTAALEGNTVGSYQATEVQSSQKTDTDKSWRSIDVTDKAWQQKNIEASWREEKIKTQMLDDIIAKNGWTVKEGTWGNMSDDFSTHREVFDKNGRRLGIYGNSYIYGINGEQAKQALESAGLVVNKYKHYSVPMQNAESDVKYSLPSDEDYLAAVSRGDTVEEQRMVDEAAKSAGVFTNDRGRPIKLYHGTRKGFGFTVFDTNRAGWGLRAIWTTDNRSVASGYSEFGYDRSASSKYIPDDGTDETIIRNTKNVTNNDVERLTEEKAEEIRQELLKEFTKLAEMETAAMNESQDYVPPADIETDFWQVVQAFNDILNEDQFLFDEDKDFREEYLNRYTTQQYVIGFNAIEARDRVREYYNNNPEAKDDLKQNGNGYYKLLYGGYEHGDGIIDLEYKYKKLIDISDKFIYPGTGSVISRSDLLDYLEQEEGRGNYTLYGIPGDKPFEVDAKKSFWTAIQVPEIGEGYYSTDSIVKWARDNGYTSVVIRNVMDPGVNNAYGDDYVFFNANQLKSADPVTYDNGNPIPLSERFTDNPDIRYALSSDSTLEQQIQQWLTDNGLEDADLSDSEARALYRNLPKDGKKGDGVRQWAVAGAQASDELDEAAKRYVFANRFYKKQTNAENLAKGIKWIHSNATEDDPTGYHNSLDMIMNDNFVYWTAEGQAQMVAAIGMAAAQNDTYGQVALADAYDRQGTDLGRALQLRNIWRLMTPEGRKKSLKNMVDKLNIELKTKGKKGKDGDLKLSEWIYEAAAMAEDEGEMERVRKAAKQELAEQLPANWKDRVRSFRIFAMLANPRTHVRNVLGNFLFVPAVSIKNKIGAALELAKPQGERTKTLAVRLSDDIRAFARQDADNRKGELTGDSRWQEGDSVKREQKPFTGKMSWLQKAIDANTNALEWEDWKFLKGHYARALGGWMQANGYSVADMEQHPEWLEKGRAYAQQEAQKATYRDFNSVANKLNQLSRQGGPIGFLVDATLPFKKTPANIVKRGLEYSVIGLAKSLSTDLYHLHQYNEAKANGETIMPDKAISPNEFIDHLSAGLTGTAIMALGAFLSSIGVITVGLDDDDDKFEKAKGGQEYALKIKIGDDEVTYTLDWAAPMCMPFFVGAAVFEQLSEGNGSLTFSDVVNDLSSIAEPVFNLSMLDGINSLLRTNSYDGMPEITQILGKIASNYATSYVPAFAGTLTRTFDDQRRKAFVKSGESADLMGTWRYAWEQTENKIYWLAKTNIPYRNIWGEPEGDSLGERFFENWLSPGYLSTIRKDPLIDEMERLYSSEDVTDNKKSALIPKLPNGKANDIALEPEQYDQFTVIRGQTAKGLLNELMDSDYYKSASDQAKATMVGEAWDFATQIASSQIVGKKPENWVSNSRTNPAQGIINRQKDRAVSDEKKYWKNEAVKAVSVEDYEALDVCIEKLKEMGVDVSSVKTAVGNAYKPEYIEAYQNGDRQKMIEIESILDMSGLGFDKVNKQGMDTYDQWIANMNKQIAEDEDEI